MSRATTSLYEAVSAGQRHVGMEHWLPLFHDHLETLLDYCPEAIVTADHQIAEAFQARHELITDYYDARRKTGGKGGMSGGADYKPVPPERLYLKPSEWDRLLEGHAVAQFTSFDAGTRCAEHDRSRAAAATKASPRRARRRASTCSTRWPSTCKAANAAGRRVVIAGYTEGSAARLQHLLQEHGATTPVPVPDYATVLGLPPGAVGVAVWSLEHGFVLDGLEVIGEEDILGDRLSRPAKKRRPSERFIAEAAALSEGDLVVHREHGVGRYEGLVTLEIQLARHDCLRLTYEGGDKLFVPVENIDVLSRYGAGEEGAQLDRLGGVAWQSRKARLKQRIADMADRLIKIAAERAIRRGETMSPPDGLYEEFCARFPYAETDDQLQAIADVLEDMSSGKPMDRLICGDVGFGKTEVALRAAFVAALSGKQVAVIGPTTLLARQHHRTFVERFQGLPVRIGRLSRLVGAKEAKATKQAMKEGAVDIVIGTHALLAKSVEFKDLGLLIVDEEQHFGVAHKERLKELRADVHVLTLTATPIPRTLQLALTGVRDMSLIATPPVDRLAVRTFVTPFDGVTIREALLREQYRGGQTFYVCPRIEDLAQVAAELRELVPEIRMAMAHGRLTPTAIENTMQDFVDGKFDVLLSTNIVEIGPRHQQRQHHGDPPRRHVRPGPALPAQGPHRPRQDPRLCLSHRAARPGAERGGVQAARGDADARHAGRGLPARQPRPRHPRRRQPSGRGAVRPYPRGRHRALPAAPRGGGGSGARAGARGRTRRLVAAAQSRHPGAAARGVHRRPVGAHGPLPPHRRARQPGRDRFLRRRAGRPFRQDAARGRVPAEHGGAQGAVPRRRGRPHRCRREGGRAVAARQQVRPARKSSSPGCRRTRLWSGCGPTTA